MDLEKLANQLEIEEFTKYQVEALKAIDNGDESFQRWCLYLPTGRGKTIIAMAGLSVMGEEEVLILAPPPTHKSWLAVAKQLGIEAVVMSHKKFGMKGTKVSRFRPIIVDEFHMLGGRTAVGWKKMFKIASMLEAPLLALSATPSYNAAERVYCVEAILTPKLVKGGFEAFLYKHCELEPSYRGLPTVVGFKNFDSAEEYLKALPQVIHVPDEAAYLIQDYNLHTILPNEFDALNWDERTQSHMPYIISRSIAAQRFQMIGEDGKLRKNYQDWLLQCLREDAKPSLVYCDHATIAKLVHEFLLEEGWSSALVTGKTSAKRKDEILDGFRNKEYEVLVGTKTLATGTDGLDKVADTLVLLQDTPDHSLRRQLVGRTLPRGLSGDYSNKRFFRARS